MTSNLLAIGAIISGVFVITAKNPVVSVLFLISVFVNVAGYLVLMGVAYLGLAYLIIYIGAIAVLFLFVIMMLNLRLVELIDTGRAYQKNLPLASTIIVMFLILMNNTPLVTSHSPLTKQSNNTSPHLIESIQNSDELVINYLQIESIGHGLYTYAAI